MRTGEIEKLTGPSRHTLRYYERKGLLHGVQRTSSGYRIYADQVLNQINLIKGLKALGFGLDEIRPVLNAVNDSAMNCADGAKLLALKRASIERQVQQLKKLSQQLLKEQQRLEERARKNGVTPSDKVAMQ
ncbi:MAG TPA: MerR family transcriptional regulator [Acidobacteriaceae bacterium]|nr:MerR family transcriptional regulator [Acidobacteriaceae bacterium]